MKKVALLLVLLIPQMANYGAAVSDKPIWQQVADKVHETRVLTLSDWEVEFSAEDEYGRYKEYDKLLQAKKDQLLRLPIVGLGGGLHFGMSPEDMQKVIKQRFCLMQEKGKVIPPATFESIKDEYYTSAPGIQTDLTRIWGADYLKHAFKRFSMQEYAVPEFIIVTDNPKRMLVTMLDSNKYVPLIKHLRNGRIYFKNIQGESAIPHRGGRRSELPELKKIGFGDFTDPGNVRLMEGKKYVIDTEFKSFQQEIKKDHLLPQSAGDTLEYAKKRFKLLYPDFFESGSKTIEIDLSDCK